MIASIVPLSISVERAILPRLITLKSGATLATKGNVDCVIFGEALLKIDAVEAGNVGHFDAIKAVIVVKLSVACNCLLTAHVDFDDSFELFVLASITVELFRLAVRHLALILALLIRIGIAAPALVPIVGR